MQGKVRYPCKYRDTGQLEVKIILIYFVFSLDYVSVFAGLKIGALIQLAK